MVDEDMFLSLLVAEMQYQDPLEPTSNTEYVSELASFTQVSSLQEMNKTMSSMGAQNLVGQYVTILTDDGEEIMGQVDYTTKKDGETMVSVNDELYSIDNVNEVIDSRYYDANTQAAAFSSMMAKLPDVDKITATDDDIQAVSNAQQLLDSFSDYTLQFVEEGDIAKLQNLWQRLNSLLTPSDNNNNSPEDTDPGAAGDEEPAVSSTE